MSETGEAQEARPESKVVHRVKEAASVAFEKTKAANKEYWEIRKSIQEKMAWHGGGVYRQHVENMDKVTNFMFGPGEKGFGRKVLEASNKIGTRLTGAVFVGAAATADIAYNLATWPFRLFVPIPKDIFKRGALLASNAVVASRAVGAGVIGTETAVVKGSRAVGEAVWTAPEVAATMAERRVNEIIEKIKKPRQTS